MLACLLVMPMTSGADRVPDARRVEEVADGTGRHLRSGGGELCTHWGSTNTGGHDEDTWSRAGVPNNTVEFEVLHSIPTAAENVDGTAEAIGHALEVTDILDDDDERA